MLDKQQAFMLECYSNKRQVQSLMGAFIESTWLSGTASLPQPARLDGPFPALPAFYQKYRRTSYVLSTKCFRHTSR